MICIEMDYRDYVPEPGMELPNEQILFMKETSVICSLDDDVQLRP
jgi:hypothetical protein